MTEPEASQTDGRIPTTVITGFLGSGKTTLINHVLHHEHGKKLAVIVNEFGEVSIDGQLIVNDEQEDLVEFNNGCLCCTVRGDLVDTLDRLQQQSDELDGILIETTGLADPAPVASTFFVSDDVKARIRLDSFVVLVDAVNLESNLEQSHEAQEQLAFGDIVLINKTDLVDEAALKRLEKRVREFNPLAKIHYTANAEVDLAKIIDVGAFELEAKLEVDPTFLEDLDHEHDDAVTSFVLRETRPIDINRFMLWMNDFAAERGESLYRTKGVFNAHGFQERLVFQSVRMLTTLRPGDAWSADEERRTEFVVIGKNLDKQEFIDGFNASLATVRPQ